MISDECHFWERKEHITYFTMLLNLCELDNDADWFPGLCLEHIPNEHPVFFVVLNVAGFPNSKWEQSAKAHRLLTIPCLYFAGGTWILNVNI
jgi:hypothetical protein